MNFIKQQKLEVISQVLEEKGSIQIRIRQSETENLMAQLNKIDALKVSYLKTA